MLGKFETIFMTVLMVVAVLAGLSAMEYRRLYHASETALELQNKALKQQKQDAADELALLTQRVAAQQTALEESDHKAKENEDAFNKQLDAMRSALDGPVQPPIRVRVVPGSCGSSGARTAAAGAGPAAGSAATPAPATGLLDPAVSQRLRGLIFEVEELQRDFNTCRAELIGRHDAHHALD